MKTPVILASSFAVFLATSSLAATATAANSFQQFVCRCQATGPGVERNLQSVKKFCSYDCTCMGLNPGAPVTMNIPAKIRDVQTSSYSLESWDYKSQTCHGQYAWRPSFDAPAWKIQVRFAPFTVTSEGVLIFPESLETAQGVNELGKPFKMTAPEVVETLSGLLKTSKP